MQDHTPGLETVTVPSQPESDAPVKRGKPILIVLVAVIVLIAVANLGNLLNGRSKAAPRSSLPAQPAIASPQQVRSFQTMQATEARRDADEQAQRFQLQTALAQAQAAQTQVPGPEVDAAAPMTPAQRQAIYGDSPNALQRTSGASQAHAEARQRELAREKQRQDAFNSDTVAIDFGRPGSTPTAPNSAVPENRQDVAGSERASEQGSAHLQTAAAQKNDPLAAYPFDAYQGKLFRVFEGTVLEGVVTNHVDGGFAGPILVMLTTDYYSHDHQQLLMPQGTRLIGSVQSVGTQGQRKLMVSFHRAVCPDGFSIDFDKYIGLDPIGTTGLASHVDNHILSSFAAAAAIGGLAGLAQVGNTASILQPSTQVRNGITSQTSREAEQVLNHFLNRLPVITLKEGSRARIYIGRDILIPSYAEHRVDPTL